MLCGRVLVGLLALAAGSGSGESGSGGGESGSGSGSEGVAEDPITVVTTMTSAGDVADYTFPLRAQLRAAFATARAAIAPRLG